MVPKRIKQKNYINTTKNHLKLSKKQEIKKNKTRLRLFL